MTLKIATESNQYSLRRPAHRFKQGKRDVYYFALDLSILDGLLPQRVEDSVVKDANRRLTPSHAENIRRYLSEVDDWLLGGLMLGIAPDAVEFKPYDETAHPNFGELRILTNRMNTMRIFDGQHRRRAIQDVLSELSDAGDARSREKLNELQKSSMTVILYAEDNLDAVRMMFVDASQNKRIEGNTVTRFDQRTAINVSAVRLAKDSRMFSGRVEMERSSVSRTSVYLASINQLASMCRDLEVGYGHRINDHHNEILMENQEEFYERCKVWADEFMLGAREEYEGLVSREIDGSEIPGLRASSFAYSVTFMRLVVNCYRLWLQKNDSWEPLQKLIREASVKHGDRNGLLAEAGILDPSGENLVSRRQEVISGARYIVNKAKRTIK